MGSCPDTDIDPKMTLITKMGKEKNKTNSFIMNWAMLSHQKF